MPHSIKNICLLQPPSKRPSRRALSRLDFLPAVLCSILSILFATSPEKAWGKRIRNTIQHATALQHPRVKPEPSNKADHHTQSHLPHSPTAAQLSPTSSSFSGSRRPFSPSLSPNRSTSGSPSSRGSFSRSSSGGSSPFSPFSPGEASLAPSSPFNSPRTRSPSASSPHTSLHPSSQGKPFQKSESPENPAPRGEKSPQNSFKLPAISQLPRSEGLAAAPGGSSLFQRRMRHSTLSSAVHSEEGGISNNNLSQGQADASRTPGSEAPESTHEGPVAPADLPPERPKLGFRDRFRNGIRGSAALDLSETGPPGGQKEEALGNHPAPADASRAPASEAPDSTHQASGAPAVQSQGEPNQSRKRKGPSLGLDLSGIEEGRAPGVKNNEEEADHLSVLGISQSGQSKNSKVYEPTMGLIAPLTLGTQLGKGGHARVHQAELPYNGQKVPVAAKPVSERELMMSDQLSSNPETRKAIIPLLGASRDEDGKATAYMAKAEKIMGDQPLDVKEASHVTADLLRDLRAIHQEGVVHRDVKPDNLMKLDGTAKLSDFGSAATKEELLKDPNLSRTGTTENFEDPRIAFALQSPGGPSWDQAMQADLWAAGKTSLELRGKSFKPGPFIEQKEVNSAIDEAYPNNTDGISRATNSLLKSLMKVNQSAPLDPNLLQKLEDALKEKPHH